jgi:exosortase
MSKRLHWFAVALLILTAAWLYVPVVGRLARQWLNDDNYSHGLLVVPLALYFAWQRRERLRAIPVRPSNVGLCVLVLSLAALAAGRLGAELFLARTSLLGVIAGSVIYLFGWSHLRVLAFPLALVLLAIPLPSIVFNQIAFPLQLFASQVGERALLTLDVPVLREGNLLVLPSTTLEVAEACSGIRSLMSLMTIGVLLGYVAEHRTSLRTLLVVATIPIAVLTNSARVAATGLAAQYWSPETAEGVFHTFSGWVVFAVAVGVLLLVHRISAWSWTYFKGAGPHPPRAS